MLQSKVAYFENSGAIRDAVGQLLVQSGRYIEAIDMFRQASILAEDGDSDSVRERMAMACFYAQAIPRVCRGPQPPAREGRVLQAGRPLCVARRMPDQSW